MTDVRERLVFTDSSPGKSRKHSSVEPMLLRDHIVNARWLKDWHGETARINHTKICLDKNSSLWILEGKNFGTLLT